MDAAQREQTDQIDHATQRLLDDARTIPEADLRAPSLLPGWTRAHVLAHVAPQRRRHAEPPDRRPVRARPPCLRQRAGAGR
jgi:uncharacterized protein (TIGR03083 family)